MEGVPHSSDHTHTSRLCVRVHVGADCEERTGSQPSAAQAQPAGTENPFLLKFNEEPKVWGTRHTGLNHSLEMEGAKTFISKQNPNTSWAKKESFPESHILG